MSESSATLTLHVIKSFPYRTSKNLVLRELDLDKVSVAGLKALARHGMSTTSTSDLFRYVANV